MKKFFYLMAALTVSFGMVSCGGDKPEPEPTPTPQPEVKAPTADFTFTTDGLTVTFTNKSENAASYKWEFGDDETSKEASPKHEYAGAGEYTVTLTAANSAGATSKKTATVNVAGKAEAYFSHSVVEGRAGEFGKNIAFDATSSANAASIVWDFGDGSSSTEFTVNHLFESFGTYNVKITVTGIGGDTAEYTEAVEVVKDVELIKGGSMEEDDAKFWSVAPYWGYDAGQYSPIEGVYSYAPTWGHNEPGFGKGGCYRFTSNPLGWDFNNKGAIYQSFEVREGDVIEIDALLKWGEKTQDNGHFSLRYSYDEFYCDFPDEGAPEGIITWFNNWWGVHDPGDGDDWERFTEWVPAFEGNLVECLDAMADYGAGQEMGWTENGKIYITAPKSGNFHLIFCIDQVWGFAFGPGRDVYVDEVSVKAVID